MDTLDFIAAQYASKIIEDSKGNNKLENLLNTALGILAEQGPFALLLWAESSKAEHIGENLIEKTTLLLTEDLCVMEALPTGQKLSVFFNEQVGKRFSLYMMVRQILERMLIYARYYAKAKGE